MDFPVRALDKVLVNGLRCQQDLSEVNLVHGCVWFTRKIYHEHSRSSVPWRDKLYAYRILCDPLYRGVSSMAYHLLLSPGGIGAELGTRGARGGRNPTC